MSHACTPKGLCRNRAARRGALLCALAGAGHLASAQNLLRNPGFEAVPAGTTGPGLLPAEWVPVHGTPDTYSNDGSFGLSPDAENAFTGIVAHEGVRFVAAWRFDDQLESFGQDLTTPLEPGCRYRVRARQILGTGDARFTSDGTYRVNLIDSSGEQVLSALLWPPLQTAGTWEEASATFRVPAAPLPIVRVQFIAVYLGTQGGGTYPGLDDVSLTLDACTPDCDSVDFNNDGQFPDDNDLIAFLSVLSGTPCETCNDIDFNNDGVFPDDADFEAMLRVLGGGEC